MFLLTTKMDSRNWIRIVILGCLFLYFVNKVVDSVNKLEEAKIGTLFRRITEDTVQGGNLFLCLDILGIYHSP